MGVLQSRRVADLALEAVGTERGGEIGAEDLERHLAIVLQVSAR